MNRNLSFNFYIWYFFRGWKEFLLRNGPIFITLFITARCNARCEHCFYWAKIENAKDELALEEIEKISNFIPSFPKLLLSGGEPFLRKDIDEICRIFYEKNKVRQITIPTNGILVNEIYEKTKNILKFCKKANIQIQLSIDGVGENHDRIRKIPHTFNRVMKTYELLKQLEEKYKRLELNFCFTFSSLNQNYVQDVYEYIVEQNNEDLRLLLTRKPVKNKYILDFDFGKFEEWSRTIINKSIMKKKNISEAIFTFRWKRQLEIIKDVMEDKSFKFKCRAGTLTAVIDELGIVYPCESSNFSFGSLRKENYDFRKIWHGSEACLFRESLKKGCRCTHESNIITNVSFSLTEYLEFLKNYLKGKI